MSEISKDAKLIKVHGREGLNIPYTRYLKSATGRETQIDISCSTMFFECPAAHLRVLIPNQDDDKGLLIQLNRDAGRPTTDHRLRLRCHRREAAVPNVEWAGQIQRTGYVGAPPLEHQRPYASNQRHRRGAAHCANPDAVVGWSMPKSKSSAARSMFSRRPIRVCPVPKGDTSTFNDLEIVSLTDVFTGQPAPATDASLTHNLTTFAHAVSTACAAIRTDLGSKGSLQTTNKSNLVAAVNELHVAIEDIVAHSGASINDATTSTLTTWSSSKISRAPSGVLNGVQADLDTLSRDCCRHQQRRPTSSRPFRRQAGLQAGASALRHRTKDLLTSSTH
jgi:hypothetical protein